MEDSKYSIEGNRWSNGVSKVERGNSYSHNGDLGYKHRDGIVRKYLRPKYSVPNPPTYSNFWIDGNFTIYQKRLHLMLLHQEQIDLL